MDLSLLLQFPQAIAKKTSIPVYPQKLSTAQIHAIIKMHDLLTVEEKDHLDESKIIEKFNKYKDSIPEILQTYCTQKKYHTNIDKFYQFLNIIFFDKQFDEKKFFGDKKQSALSLQSLNCFSSKLSLESLATSSALLINTNFTSTIVPTLTPDSPTVYSVPT